MRILLAIDESATSRQALRNVLSHHKPKGTAVRVLNVVEPISAYLSAELMPHYVPQVASVEQDRLRQAKQMVAQAALQLRKAGFQASHEVESGDPKAKILDAARAWRADLIVLGSHGWKGLTRFLMGSVSESVVRHASCSVEVVRIRSARRASR